MSRERYVTTINAIKDMQLELGRLQRENAALRTHCDTLTNRVGVLRREVAILKGCKPANILLAPVSTNNNNKDIAP